ncbi:DEAD/DEAH box helicase family protein [Candidatus Poribacteria bacterium]|nr:DEAD/DEAH box helicase family protein [Candidatus Poribacteria bacterium]
MQPPFEGPPELYLSADAAAQLADEIAEAGGVEVFFIGKRGAGGLVTEVESHACGSETAVPVLTQLVSPGDVIIHNHPSGQLMPSAADLDISARLGLVGAGSYIVNNDCSRVRVVVRPHDPKKKSPVSPEEVEALLGPESQLVREVGEYEDRPQQRRMAALVTASLNNDGIAVIEAGTGTGKSLAYLIPAVLYGLANGERVIVSTNTINLQEQILHKDLPVVQRVLNREFKAEIVKGRSNYVCKRKAQFARDQLTGQAQLMIGDEFTAELRELLAWTLETQSGDRQELNIPPREEVWERVVSEADNCLRVRCPFYESCFFYNSRRRAARANVLVVNHSLLMSDLAVRRESNNWSTAAVLPPCQYIILDEAHHIEEVATQHLGFQLSRAGLRRLFARLHRSDARGQRGVLTTLGGKLEELRAGGKLGTESPIWKLFGTDVLSRAQDASERADQLLEDFAYVFLDIADLPPPSRGLEHRVRLTPAVLADTRWGGECTERIAEIADAIGGAVGASREVIKLLGELDADVIQGLINIVMEWRSILDRLDGQRRMALAFVREDDAFCPWVEVRTDARGRLLPKLCRAPISVADVLRESLHSRVKTEILTSATLSVDHGFGYLAERIGLSGLQGRQAQELLLETPFDFERQVFFGVPNDLGDPRHQGFDDQLARFITRAVTESGGRAFVLFTSNGQMRRMYQTCSAPIGRLGIRTLLQGEESRDRLLQRFREDETSVLFATSSFWEGVDVKGRALELLIIARLPFAVPSDPIQEAQFEYLREHGRDPFQNLVVPRAIIRLKQGVGRLIRAKTDRGAVLITDDRVVRMGYGRRFLQSLPKVEVRVAQTDQLMAGLRTFYRSA